MKKPSLLSILILRVLLATAYAPRAPATRGATAAGRALAAALETATLAPLAQATVSNPCAAAPASTQAIATPLQALLTPKPAGPTLAGTSWIMSSLNGALPVKDTTVTLQLEVDGPASGADGCNRYWTTNRVDGSSISFGQPAASTRMMCEAPMMRQEAALMQALAAADKFELRSNQLTLLEGAKVLATFVTLSQELAGSVWQVTAYNNGGRQLSACWTIPKSLWHLIEAMRQRATAAVTTTSRSTCILGAPS